MKIELLSHTPDGDLLVVNAARCSFDKEHKELEASAYRTAKAV